MRFIAVKVRAKKFQFTRPYGARLGQGAQDPFAFQFQFTRPYGARPGRPAYSGAMEMVSIHAPLRSATVLNQRWGSLYIRFNSRAPTERDADIPPESHADELFQFTRPYGARPGLLGKIRPNKEVSIHAPLRSATVKNTRG